MALAALAGLTYFYPGSSRPSLDEVTLALEPGLTLLAGPSGGGKSTLLRVLNGLVPHFHGGRIGGRATVAGLDVLATPTRLLAREVGFVFQDPERQFVYSLVESEVAFGMENLAVPRPRMLDRVEAALAAAGALELRGRRLATLSGGEKQRVAIACALALEPRLLVLDEPCSQLDAEGTAAIHGNCRELAAGGMAVVLAEHRGTGLESARLLTISDGKVRPGRDAEPAPRPHLAAPRGEEAWALAGVTCGPDRRPLLAAVNAAGAEGEVVALTGPNGGGKTTLLRVLAGLLPPLSGTARRAPGRVAYLPQDPGALLHQPSVLAEIELTVGGRDREQGMAILSELGVEGLAARDPRDLSVGERQRVAIAAVLAGAPRLALLDEPTRGMDAVARDRLQALLSRLAGEGAAIVVATHDSELMGAVADRRLLVAGGLVRELDVITGAST